jgi:hypothetical protein
MMSDLVEKSLFKQVAALIIMQQTVEVRSTPAHTEKNLITHVVILLIYFSYIVLYCSDFLSLFSYFLTVF